MRGGPKHACQGPLQLRSCTFAGGAPFEVHGLYDVSGATPIMGVDVRTTGATMEGRATTEASIVDWSWISVDKKAIRAFN